MKIAGLKNDGAWFRYNKKIREQFENSPDDADSLQVAIQDIETLEDFYNVLVDLGTEIGQVAGGDLVPATQGALAEVYSHSGIPRQVWLGNLSWDIYLPPNSEGNPKAYPVKKHQAIVAEFALDLRDCVKKFFLSRRQIADIVNIRKVSQGNPGGIADAKKDAP